ncbi:unnamed protein product [Sordaria macrospora k-hell]|uniref:Ubiquitin carboxyl-terminal hydrolase n=1 Tax=Sordaria macrospora (strain ATCC MYA-333 / DSM 997 / K(L3346) / K-hell) TaxID=771870 RepID=F7VSR3_SORMK|nr:uncharacterized protein SMAC_06800 [Sordaria macrospora k-hell]CCC08730.1 unnamed protein product [Sordaria macrospora k-hell]
MSTISVVVKHQGKKYDVDVDTSATGEVFKYQLYSLTGVEPDRQKVLLKGSQLKDDTDMSKVGLKPGQMIMMMGTPGEGGGAIARPTEKVKFIEDMTEAEAAQQAGATPAGLQNYGNTCYLNSTLQVLRSIPELSDALKSYKGEQSMSDPTTQLRNLYDMMSKTQEGIPPLGFLHALRVTYPPLKQKLKIPEGDAAKDASFIDKYMGLELTSVLECDEPGAKEAGEEPKTTKDRLLKLNCHIDGQTNHLRDGIVNGLVEKLEKKSEVLDREATYTKRSQISRLPKYLTVHFMRFFWKREVQKKAKIMRKVTFPFELDVVEFCTDDLRKALIPVRDKVREVRKEEHDIERARKRRKMNPIDGENAQGSTPSSSSKDKKKDEKKPSGGDVEMTTEETFKTDAEFEAEKEAEVLAAKKELYSLINQDLLKDEGANQSGLYELRGVITHQGASADSGHYTAYVKKTGIKDPVTGKIGEEDGKWWWFNDDKVSEVEAEKITALAGGGESHSALVLLYRAIPLPSADGTQ